MSKIKMALFIIALMGAVGCTKDETTNNLTVTVEKENIKCIKLECAKDSSVENKKDLFKFAFGKDASTDIKYIKYDEKVYLDFGSNKPDKISIKDRLLNSNGENLYTDKEIIEVPFTNENNKFYFTVKKHPASALSSVYMENRTDFRGFSIKASWGENEYVYAFVIKTDISQALSLHKLLTSFSLSSSICL